MRIVYLGSGEFGLPTLRALCAAHDVALVVSQPDRPAGRGRRSSPTPIAAFAEETGVPCRRPADPNDGETAAAIARTSPDALVVIAYGHKLGPELLDDRFAVNLHASLLPRYRGAAPINWAMIRGEARTGVSVITLAQRMDAGLVLARRSVAIEANETAGELHDRLALLGPEAVADVLARRAAGTLDGEAQDPGEVTWAPKLAKRDGTVDFAQPAAAVRCRVHGLTPWPGCRVQLDETVLRLHRLREVAGDEVHDATPGSVTPGGVVRCADGAVELLEVQPAGGRLMPFGAFARGHAIAADARLRPITP